MRICCVVLTDSPPQPCVYDCIHTYMYMHIYRGTSSAGGVDKRKIVPNHLMPVLASMVESAQSTGMEKLVNRFVCKHPEVSKRQAEKKIQEIAVKRKLPGESMPHWSLRPEFADLTKGGAGAVRQNRSDKTPTQKDESGKVVENGSGNDTSTIKKRKNTTAVVAGSGGPAQKKPRNPYSFFKVRQISSFAIILWGFLVVLLLK